MTDRAEDPAIVAFERLRVELSELRNVVAEWPERFEERDYSITLSEIVQSLVRIEAHPALKAGPDEYERQRVRAAEQAGEAFGSQVRGAMSIITTAAREVQSVLNQVKTRARLHSLLIAVGFIGFVIGTTVSNLTAAPVMHPLPGRCRLVLRNGPRDRADIREIDCTGLSVSGFRGGR